MKLYHRVLPWFLLFCKTVLGQDSSCAARQSNGALISNKDMALEGHVRETLEKITFIQCSLRCLKEDWCISLSFEFQNRMGKCELNDYGVEHETSVSIENGEFEKKEGFVYSQLRPAGKSGCYHDRCQNGGTCTLDCAGLTPKCYCAYGFKGDRCEVDIDECSSNPCQNGGTCTDQVNGYSCSCAVGYRGTRCENNIDECSSNPCQNGGTCTDQVNGYSCSCAIGYNGTRCESSVWYGFNSSLFKLVTENKNWTDARQYCQSLGGDLVSFSTQTENTFVSKTLLWNWTYTPLVRYKMDGTDQNLSLFNGATVGNIDNTKAVYFDGVDDHATIPRVNIRTTDFTVALWIKPLSPWGWVNTVIDGTKEVQFVIYFYYGNLNVVLFLDVGEKIGLGKSGIPLNQWTYLTVTWNRDQKTARLFIDAIERSSKTLTFQNIDLADNPNPDWKIGGRDGVNNKYFKGWIRDLIVVPRTLSPEDIPKLKDDVSGIWIGLNDIATEGLFQWSDGSPLTFTQQRLAADNTDAKNCVMMGAVYGRHAEWSAEYCNKTKSFICKKK